MEKQYTSEQVANMLQDLYYDVDAIIERYVSSSLNKDTQGQSNAKNEALNILTSVEQSLSVAIDHLTD